MKRQSLLRIILLTALLGAELLFTFVFTPRFEAATGGLAFLDLSPIWDPAETVNYINSLSDEAVSIYESMQLLDMLFPVLYTATLFLFAPRRDGTRWMIFPIIAGMLFDYSENLIIYLMIHNGVMSFAGILPYISMLKFGCIGLSFAGIIYYRFARR